MTVQNSARCIARNSTNVTVNTHQCKTVAESLHSRMTHLKYSTDNWSRHELMPKPSGGVATLDHIFTLDCLNFSFWSDLPNESRFTVVYNSKSYTGFWSLCAAVKRALDEGIPITSPTYWASDDFDLSVMSHVFRSSTAELCPMLKERLRVLQEAGHVICREAGSFASILAGAHYSAAALIDILTTNFPSFNDAFTYKSHKVQLFKRAQILVADIWACFGGKSYGYFVDIDRLTMFADYRVPQILHDLGCLTYSANLESAIRRGQLLESGSIAEIELRGCSIWAVEVILEAIRSKHTDTKVNAVLLDFYLWDTAKEREANAGIPVHRVRSIYY